MQIKELSDPIIASLTHDDGTSLVNATEEQRY